MIIMKKLAIIGASYLQLPLIEKAKKRGIETHVFAWAANDVGELAADHFYPISIIEKETIFEKCNEIGIDGICSIASDLAMITVSYVAQKMGLVSNSIESTSASTNKHLMRKRFEEQGDPSPKSIMVTNADDLIGIQLDYPVIVKPLDRSGSRGITKIFSRFELDAAIENAKQNGFDKHALVEEFAEGEEFSVEFISWKGEHYFLTITKKYTTGSPGFIETGHLQPSGLSKDIVDKVKRVTVHALDSLGIRYGASHTEIKIDPNGCIKIIEIGARMGGDFIGSDLVELSTGYDFVNAVIDISLGIDPPRPTGNCVRASAVRFVLNEEDVKAIDEIEELYPEIVVKKEIERKISHLVVDSSTRFGYCLMCSEDMNKLIQCIEKNNIYI